MDELVKQVSERTGITQDQARTAVTTVLGFLKDKLPAPIAGQIDNVIGGGGTATGTAAGTAGDIAGKIGDMFK